MANKTKIGEEILQPPVVGVSVVIPALNEEGCVSETVKDVIDHLKKTNADFEVIVVDDGSSDKTRQRALEAGARILVHNKNMGYGKSIMDGISIALYDVIAIMDADGTYPAAMLPEMITAVNLHDMVIGARVWNKKNTTLMARLFRKLLYFITLYLTSVRALDYNSGFRVFRKHDILDYRQLLCPTFSFTTSHTLLSLLSGKSVFFMPIGYGERVGESKVAYFRDGFKTLSYVFMIANLFQIYRLTLAIIVMMLTANILAIITFQLIPLGIITISIIVIMLNLTFIFGMIAMATMANNQHYLFQLHGKKNE